MIKVKLSYPSWWDEAWGGGMFLWETPKRRGEFVDIKYYINQECAECDYWFVFDDIDNYLFESTVCPPENVIFITGEVKPRWQYNQKFIDQFNGVLTTRSDVTHRKIIPSQHICTWHVKKDLDYLREFPVPPKKQVLSSVISLAQEEIGHKKRVDFIKYAKSVFGDELHWFGKGVNPINDKWDAMKDYQYSIAIENSSYPGYFTEKILDCYLSFTIPIYFGCPNILDYFPEESLILIDPNEPEKSLEIIKEAIKEDYYTKHFDALVFARNKVLREVGFFPYLNSWIRKNEKMSSNLMKQKIFLEQRKYMDNRITLKQTVYQQVEKSKLLIRGFRNPQHYAHK